MLLHLNFCHYLTRKTRVVNKQMSSLMILILSQAWTDYHDNGLWTQTLHGPLPTR